LAAGTVIEATSESGGSRCWGTTEIPSFRTSECCVVNPLLILVLLVFVINLIRVGSGAPDTTSKDALWATATTTDGGGGTSIESSFQNICFIGL